YFNERFFVENKASHTILPIQNKNVDEQPTPNKGETSTLNSKTAAPNKGETLAPNSKTTTANKGETPTINSETATANKEDKI
ncbi:MAG: hypothetical protein RR405_04775, partial [Clostridia bacterium]